jgi:hypothetical protein
MERGGTRLALATLAIAVTGCAGGGGGGRGGGGIPTPEAPTATPFVAPTLIQPSVEPHQCTPLGDDWSPSTLIGAALLLRAVDRDTGGEIDPEGVFIIKELVADPNGYLDQSVANQAARDSLDDLQSANFMRWVVLFHPSYGHFVFRTDRLGREGLSINETYDSYSVPCALSRHDGIVVSMHLLKYVPFGNGFAFRATEVIMGTAFERDWP